MRITLSARSKILQLTRNGATFRVSTTGTLCAGERVDLVPTAELTELDVRISLQPSVIMDLTTFNCMIDKVIDYDANKNEFIISNRGNE